MEWRNIFPASSVIHLPRYRLDHNPILLKIEGFAGEDSGPRSFKFEHMWMSSEECHSVIQTAWGPRGAGTVTQKISNVGVHLREWGQATFGNTKKEIKRVEWDLGSLPKVPPLGVIIDHCKFFVDRLDILHKEEESFWFIRARENDFRDEDKNTSYFHHKENSYRRRNHIKGL